MIKLFTPEKDSAFKWKPCDICEERPACYVEIDCTYGEYITPICASCVRKMLAVFPPIAPTAVDR
jgi:hypothetical protein